MKVLTFLTLCIFIQNSFAQDLNPSLQKPDAVPTVLSVEEDGHTAVTPREIKVDVPVYPSLPIRENVARIYTEIKESHFFLELNPLSIKGSAVDFESNLVSSAGNPELEIGTGSFKMRVLPLDLKFGFENPEWGSFAKVKIENAKEFSELTIYTKIYFIKLGGGLSFSTSDEETTIKEQSVTTSVNKMKTIDISPYLYVTFQFVNNDTLIIEQSNKIGGSYSSSKSDDVTVKGGSFIFNPALDILFKINSKFQLGTGFEMAYERFSGQIEKNLNTFSGVGNGFGFEFNLIKTKIIF